MSKKTKIIIIVAAGILATILIWRFFNQYLYKSKAAETLLVEYLDNEGNPLTNIDIPNINTAPDKTIYLRIKIDGTIKISGFSLKLETDKGLGDHFIKIKSIGTGTTVPPASDVVGTSSSDYIYLNTWVYKNKDGNALPGTIVLKVTITGLKNGCGSLLVTPGYAVGPAGYYSPSGLSIVKTGAIGTGSCAPVPTRTPIPLNVTPTLAVPQSSNPEATYDNVNNKINFSFQFQGNNTATASLIPQCYYSEIIPQVTPTWVSMTVVTANLTPPPVGGRPYPGNTNGTLVCQSGLVTGGKAYKMIASTYAWYDADGNKSYNEAIDGVRKISASIETTLVAQVGGPTLTPTLTPTATPTVTPGGPTLTPTPTTSPRARGDANNDGSINEADFTIWITTYGTQYNTTDKLKPPINADFNNDNWVNMTDFEIWRQSAKGL